MNDFEKILARMTVPHVNPGDYTSKDGPLYCGKCRTAKQFHMDAPPLEGHLFPCPCQCEQERIDRELAEQEVRRHQQVVADLKRWGLHKPRYAQMDLCQRQRQVQTDETCPFLR